jgi:hypothetical protein
MSLRRPRMLSSIHSATDGARLEECKPSGDSTKVFSTGYTQIAVEKDIRSSLESRTTFVDYDH